MAENKTTPPTPVIPKKDWEGMKQKLNDIKTKIMEYAGKPGYNPFVYLNQLGIPQLEKDLARTDNLSDGLYERLEKLEFKVPKVDVPVVKQVI